MSKKKILITGSCGFIMGNFLRKLSYLSSKDPDKYSYSIVSVDRVNANAANSMYWNKNHIFHVADIRDQHIMDTIFQFEKPDIVLHGAAETFVDASLSDPNSFVTSNVLGTQVLLNSSVKSGVEKFIYISTDEIYGQLTSENDKPWSEEAELNPRNPYSATKAAGELLVKAASKSFGLIYNITRSSNNYGPRQTPEKLIPKAIKCIMNNVPIPIYGKGLQIRDWTHVFDNCSALMTVLQKGADNEIYNISAKQEFTNIEAIQEVCNAMKTGHNLISFIDDPRASHDFRYAVDTGKIKELGWKPNFKFKEGVADTICWYMDNKWFMK